MRGSQQAALADISHLPAAAQDRLRQLLLTESAAQEAHLAQHEAAVNQLRDLTDADSVLERELAEAGSARAREVIADVEHALQRLDAGTYGRCESCQPPIPVERLEAIPSARFCVACPERRPGWPR